MGPLLLELGNLGALLSSCYFGRVVGFNDEGGPRELGRLLAIEEAPVLEEEPEGGCTGLDP
jgi:hypothetical protein